MGSFIDPQEALRDRLYAELEDQTADINELIEDITDHPVARVQQGGVGAIINQISLNETLETLICYAYRPYVEDLTITALIPDRKPTNPEYLLFKKALQANIAVSMEGVLAEMEKVRPQVVRDMIKQGITVPEPRKNKRVVMKATGTMEKGS